MSVLDKAFEIASRHLPAAGIDCVLIGGFAVNHYGYTRGTLDVDFMIVADRLDDVRSIMPNAGFTNIDVRENAVFFSAPDEGLRVDFLRVDAATMDRLLADAVTVSIRGHALRIPSLRDILAMKIFALSQDTARRMGKDLPDIAYLTVINELGLEEDLRPLCDRFGTPGTCRLIEDAVRGLEAP